MFTSHPYMVLAQSQGLRLTLEHGSSSRFTI